MTTYEQELTDKCTAEHPDHQYIGQSNGHPWLWTVWCVRCDKLGYNTDDARNRPNPAMSAEYVEAVRLAACLVYQEVERISAERRQKKRKN